MHNKLNIQPGQRYGRLTVLYEVEKHNGRRQFACKCDCGKIAEVALIRLTTNKTKSCGCLLRENSKTHGEFGTKLYNVWNSMKQRCSNPKVSSYPHYGGRGIAICEDWLRFEPFRDWSIESGYKEGLSIDRIDNDGGYNPNNCRWANKRQQANNRASNRVLTHNGRSLSIASWARLIGINQRALSKRLARGWSVAKTLEVPLTMTNG